MKHATFLSALFAAAVIAQPALAQQLNEFDSMPFSLAVHPRMVARVLSEDSAGALAFSGALPSDTAAIDILELKWPKSDLQCRIAIGQTGAAYGRPGDEPRTVMAVSTTGGASPVPLDAEAAKGSLGRMCVWPTAEDGTADLIVLASLSGGLQDSRIIAFAISPTGAVTAIDTSKAATVYGWFEVRDLDNNGSYELITSRNLDGALGGLSYHAVRAYDAAAHKYAPAPDAFKSYMQTELDWLNWVLVMRDTIQADPEPYTNKTDSGPIYVAAYNGLQYGFDTLIELPLSSNLVTNVSAYNAARREALGLVRKYRDELQAWLNGGAYPATWKMAR
jgi:hypothetical protein